MFFPTAIKNLLRQRRAWLYLLLLILFYGYYISNVASNPPGFYVDESSIAINAQAISVNARDEHNIFLPLYFRAFSEYKNPLYVYLLAAVFKVFGPSILAARLLSATLGFAAVLLLGLLAWRISNSRAVSLFVALTAFFTPWLFEISRFVFEVALFPVALIVFLLFLHQAYSKQKWSLVNCVALALSLGLITYTYSIGRLLAPLLAFGLVLFINRQTWFKVILVWIFYSLTLIPLAVFSQQNPGALTNRFNSISYLTGDAALVQILWRFSANYFYNVSPWFLLLAGDPNSRHHIPGMGNMLVATLILIIFGFMLSVYQSWSDSWWRYILYGLAVSLVPASLTNDNFHSLRLIALPIFLLLSMIPALLWIIKRAQNKLLWRLILVVLISGTLFQAIFFQWQYAREGRSRNTDFEAEYSEVINFALNNSEERIYLIDDSYAHAYWYATLEKLDLSRFSRERENVPANAVMVGYKTLLRDCQIMMVGEKFAVCRKP